MSLPIPNAITWLNDSQKKIWRALVISQVLTGKALATSPNTPPAVVKILRDAYAAAFKDKDFTAGVEKIQQEPADVIPGDKLQEMVETSLAEFKASLPEYKALQRQIFERYVKGL